VTGWIGLVVLLGWGLALALFSGVGPFFRHLYGWLKNPATVENLATQRPFITFELSIGGISENAASSTMERRSQRRIPRPLNLEPPESYS
jgi:hypothetical protein